MGPQKQSIDIGMAHLSTHDIRRHWRVPLVCKRRPPRREAELHLQLIFTKDRDIYKIKKCRVTLRK